jgi:hypothetical protein
MHRKRVYSVQIYNNCAILFQITYTLYIKPYVFCTSIYSLTWNGVYFTVPPGIWARFFRGFVMSSAAGQASRRDSERATYILVYRIL